MGGCRGFWKYISDIRTKAPNEVETPDQEREWIESKVQDDPVKPRMAIVDMSVLFYMIPQLIIHKSRLFTQESEADIEATLQSVASILNNFVQTRYPGLKILVFEKGVSQFKVAQLSRQKNRSNKLNTAIALMCQQGETTTVRKLIGQQAGMSWLHMNRLATILQHKYDYDCQLTEQEADFAILQLCNQYYKEYNVIIVSVDSDFLVYASHGQQFFALYTPVKKYRSLTVLAELDDLFPSRNYMQAAYFLAGNDNVVGIQGIGIQKALAMTAPLNDLEPHVLIKQVSLKPTIKQSRKPDYEALSTKCQQFMASWNDVEVFIPHQERLDAPEHSRLYDFVYEHKPGSTIYVRNTLRQKYEAYIASPPVIAVAGPKQHDVLKDQAQLEEDNRAFRAQRKINNELFYKRLSDRSYQRKLEFSFNAPSLSHAIQESPACSVQSTGSNDDIHAKQTITAKSLIITLQKPQLPVQLQLVDVQQFKFEGPIVELDKYKMKSLYQSRSRKVGSISSVLTWPFREYHFDLFIHDAVLAMVDVENHVRLDVNAKFRRILESNETQNRLTSLFVETVKRSSRSASQNVSYAELTQVGSNEATIKLTDIEKMFRILAQDFVSDQIRQDPNCMLGRYRYLLIHCFDQIGRRNKSCFVVMVLQCIPKVVQQHVLSLLSEQHPNAKKAFVASIGKIITRFAMGTKGNLHALNVEDEDDFDADLEDGEQIEGEDEFCYDKLVERITSLTTHVHYNLSQADKDLITAVSSVGIEQLRSKFLLEGIKECFGQSIGWRRSIKDLMADDVMRIVKAIQTLNSVSFVQSLFPGPKTQSRMCPLTSTMLSHLCRDFVLSLHPDQRHEFQAHFVEAGTKFNSQSTLLKSHRKLWYSVFDVRLHQNHVFGNFAQTDGWSISFQYYDTDLHTARLKESAAVTKYNQEPIGYACGNFRAQVEFQTQTTGQKVALSSMLGDRSSLGLSGVQGCIGSLYIDKAIDFLQVGSDEALKLLQRHPIVCIDLGQISELSIVVTLPKIHFNGQVVTPFVTHALSTAGRYAATQHDLYLRNVEEEMNQLQDTITKLQQNSLRCSSVDEFTKSALVYHLEAYKLLEANYKTERLKYKQALDNRQRSYWCSVANEILGLVDAMKLTYSDDRTGVPLLIIGNPTFSGQRHGKKSSSPQYIIKYLQRFFPVMILDEYNTSKLCPCCQHELQLVPQVGEKSTRIWRCISGCKTSDGQHELTVNKDVSAPLAFLMIATSMFASGFRPEAYTKEN